MDYSYCPIVLFTNRVMIERPDYEFSDKEKALIILKCTPNVRHMI
jgi:hypothetical protein